MGYTATSCHHQPAKSTCELCNDCGMHGKGLGLGAWGLVLICSTKEVSSELSCEKRANGIGVEEEQHSEERRGQKALKYVKESERIKALHGFAWVLQQRC